MKYLLTLLMGVSALAGTTQIDILQSNQIRLKGATSGVITLQAPAISPTHTLTISIPADLTMTTPGTSFTAARVDAGQNFVGTQTMLGSLVLSGGFNFSGASSFTGTWPYANGGTNATTQAAATANMHGAKGWTDATALQAGAADFAGQMQFTADGQYITWARDTTAGDTHEPVSLGNDIIYLQGAVESQQSVKLANLLTAGPGVTVGSGNLVTGNAMIVQSGNAALPQMIVKTATASTGISASELDDYTGGGGLTIIHGESGRGDHYQSQFLFEWFYGIDGTQTTKAAPLIFNAQGKYGGNFENHYRMGWDSDGNATWYKHVNGSQFGAAGNAMTLSNAGALAVTGSLNLGSGTTMTRVKHGTSGALTAGSIVITDSSVSANTRFFFSVHTRGTVTLPQSYDAATRSAGTSFTITSSSAIDTSTVDYLEIEP